MPQKAKSINAAKQAKYSPQEQTAGMRTARWNKLLATVDPMGTLTEAERKRQATKAQKADQQRYNAASAAMKHGCSLCGPVDPDATHKTCETHQADMQRRLSR